MFWHFYENAGLPLKTETVFMLLHRLPVVIVVQLHACISWDNSVCSHRGDVHEVEFNRAA